MKKWVLFLTGTIAALAAGFALAEDYKTLALDDKLLLQVPALSPDFRSFAGHMLGVQKFETGNAAAVVELENEESSVFVLLLFIGYKGKAYIVAEQVSYMRDSKNPKTEYLEDAQFVAKGLPSGRLDYTKKPADFTVFARWLNAKEI